MIIDNCKYDFAFERFKERESKLDDEEPVFSALLRNRKLLYSNIILQMKGEAQTKFIVWLWDKTWEDGRFWTEYGTPIRDIADQLLCSENSLRSGINDLLRKGLVMRTPAKNKTFRYCIDFDCKWLKKI